MNVIISASKALNDWLELDLPRLPATEGHHLGRQRLHSDEATLSWQCHILRSGRDMGPALCIAVEAHSRYTILLPFETRPDQEGLEKALLHRWAKEMVHHALETGQIEDDMVERVFEQFLLSSIDFYWFKNSDPSVMAHVTDAEQWVLQTLAKYGIEQLDEMEALTLGLHINKMFKRTRNQNKESVRFYPVERFLADGLYRFAHSLSAGRYLQTPAGDYPNPYATPIAKKTLPDGSSATVISLADYQRKS